MSRASLLLAFSLFAPYCHADDVIDLRASALRPMQVAAAAIAPAAPVAAAAPTVTPLAEPAPAVASTLEEPPVYTPPMPADTRDLKLGQWSYEVERMGRADGCQGEGAWVVDRNGSEETYQVICQGAPRYTAVCSTAGCLRLD